MRTENPVKTALRNSDGVTAGSVCPMRSRAGEKHFNETPFRMTPKVEESELPFEKADRREPDVRRA